MSVARHADSAHVKVVTRCRPVSSDLNSVAHIRNNNTISILDNSNDDPIERTFQFDSAFPDNTSQEQLFDSVGKDLVDVVLNGFNATLIAYGHTSSGKSYSLIGESLGTRGILPRSCEYLFEQAHKRSLYFNVTISMSVLEIFLGNLTDLGKEAAIKLKRPNSKIATSPATIPFSKDSIQYSGSDFCIPPPPTISLNRPPSAAVKGSQSHVIAQNNDVIQVREEERGRTSVYGLTQIQVSSIKEVSEILTESLAIRHSATTLLNNHSSRSHLIVTFTVSQGASKSDPLANNIVGKFSVIDLAGSEKLKKAHGDDVNPDRRREAASINTSLSVLGSVISSLANGQNHVPFRDSKLTRVLQSLGLGQGGNSYVTLLATLYPLPQHYAETVNTLTFATRCLAIQTAPTVNYNALDEMSYQAKLREMQQTVVQLTSEINFLKSELAKKGSERDESRVDDGQLKSSSVVGSRHFDTDVLPKHARDHITRMESCFKLAQSENVNALVKQVHKTLKYRSELSELVQDNSRLKSETEELINQQSLFFQQELENIRNRNSKLIEEDEDNKRKSLLRSRPPSAASIRPKSATIFDPTTSSVSKSVILSPNLYSQDHFVGLLKEKDDEIFKLKIEMQNITRKNLEEKKILTEEARKLLNAIKIRDSIISDVTTGHLSDYIHWGGLKGRFLDLPVNRRVASFDVSTIPHLYSLIPFNSDEDMDMSHKKFKNRPQSAARSWR
ncbi:hypothetical protein RCL1_002488 [Eukaryota sp. TZLM3-RCL]